MPHLIYRCDEAVKEWVADLLPHVDDFGPASAIGVASETRMLAGVVYHSLIYT